MKSKKIDEIVNSFYPVSLNSLKEIENLIKYEAFEKGDIFIKKHSSINKEYFVLEGICKSFLMNPEGEDVTLSFFCDRSILSPFTTRAKNGKSLLNFKALTHLEMASIDAHKFEVLMIDNLEIRNFGNAVLRNELAGKVKKEIGLASLTAKERLLDFRESFPMLENLIPHTDIASYLGITNISLSRLRKDKI